MIKFTYLITGLFFSNLLCASQTPSRIFGGEVISPADPLYRSAPAIINIGKLKCSCVIIDDDIVLTAAHCTPGGPYSLHFSGTIDSEGEYRSIIKEETHPNYNQNTLEADLAVGRFVGGLPSGYQKMAVAGNDLGAINDEATLVGFGTSVQGEQDTGNGILRKASVTTQELTPTSIIFDQSHGKGACYGDSGGPAVMKRAGQWFIVGIASFVDPVDCSGSVHYTRPAYYLKWMLEAIERLRQS
jgi:secreted trypsin-like serine protease